MSAMFRIEFSIKTSRDGEQDFVEVGFGSSADFPTVDHCAHEVMSILQLALWETEPGQPDPQIVAAVGHEDPLGEFAAFVDEEAERG